MPGPRPQPAAVKAQRSAVRSKHKPKPSFPGEVAAGSAVAAPSWLKDEGLKVWRRLSPTLTAAKLLTPADRETFGRYCRNFARWLKMQLALDENGETYSVTTESGTVHRARPEFVIADRIERQLLAAEDRFGLNPAERQRIFAARSQSGISGDLFGEADRRQRRTDDPASPPAEPAKPIESPVGLLN